MRGPVPAALLRGETAGGETSTHAPCASLAGPRHVRGRRAGGSPAAGRPVAGTCVAGRRPVAGTRVAGPPIPGGCGVSAAGDELAGLLGESGPHGHIGSLPRPVGPPLVRR